MLFTNPRQWTRSAVGSWWRFTFVAIANAALLVNALYVAANSGMQSGLAAALFPLLFQLFFLYALRRMYRQAIGAEAEQRAA
jgi:hypothetical protein